MNVILKYGAVDVFLFRIRSYSRLVSMKNVTGLCGLRMGIVKQSVVVVLSKRPTLFVCKLNKTFEHPSRVCVLQTSNLAAVYGQLVGSCKCMPTLFAARLVQSNEQCSIKIFVAAPPTRRHHPALNPSRAESGSLCRSFFSARGFLIHDSSYILLLLDNQI